MSCVHKHQQQRYNSENTKKCMFIDYIHVDILFPPTKVIQIMFERVITLYQTLLHGQAIIQCVTIISMCYHTRYRIFSFSLAWFGGYLRRVTMRYHQIYKKIHIHIFLEKLTVTSCANVLQIAQNQVNLKEKIQ